MRLSRYKQPVNHCIMLASGSGYAAYLYTLISGDTIKNTTVMKASEYKNPTYGYETPDAGPADKEAGLKFLLFLFMTAVAAFATAAVTTVVIATAVA